VSVCVGQIVDLSGNHYCFKALTSSLVCPAMFCIYEKSSKDIPHSSGFQPGLWDIIPGVTRSVRYISSKL